MLVEKRAKMTAQSQEKANPAPKDEKGDAHRTVTHPGANRSELLVAIRQAEVSAAEKRAAAEKLAEDIRAEGRKAALRVAEDAEREGRALVKEAVAKAAGECELVRRERLAKARVQADAIAASARVKFPELAKTILEELERGDDAKD
jgi:hypothetical protein